MNRLLLKKGLTEREMEVCVLAKGGSTNQEISVCLFVSLHTAKNHIKSIHKKLEVSTRAQLVALLNSLENVE
jgi:LuxR family transcriptional regulator, maltose regulon positive regulatory protein